MSEATPYDDERSAYSRETLARLVLCDHAVGIADSASGLVSTRHDADTGPGGRASQAAQLIELAQQALSSAVVYERERGSSWGDIGQYLGISAQEAENRFGPDVARWNTAFETPYRLDETSRKRVPELPTAAYDPNWTGSLLDTWAYIHHIGINDRHAVTAGLDMAAPQEERPKAG